MVIQFRTITNNTMEYQLVPHNLLKSNSKMKKKANMMTKKMKKKKVTLMEFTLTDKMINAELNSLV